MEIQILGAGRDAREKCDYCGVPPFEAYARYGLPVGQFALLSADAVVCGDCLEASRGLNSAGSQSLTTLTPLTGERRKPSGALTLGSEGFIVEIMGRERLAESFQEERR
jgi:hypothetical protein